MLSGQVGSLVSGRFSLAEFDRLRSASLRRSCALKASRGANSRCWPDFRRSAQIWCRWGDADRRMYVVLAQQRAVPIFRPPAENLLLVIDQRQLAIFGQPANRVVVFASDLDVLRMRRNRRKDANRIGFENFSSRPFSDRLRTQPAVDSPRHRSCRSSVPRFAGDTFSEFSRATADSACRRPRVHPPAFRWPQVRAAAVGMIEPSQPPAVGVVVRPGVHPGDAALSSAVCPRRPAPIAHRDWRK